jgi:5-methylcytosine-specific restriction protein B
VIEEINRGNPAQIFGEMLTLLEADKRTPTEALELSYRKETGERVYIPKNLYIIGTMNIADRSLAMVDFALRRRFAFVDLTPQFGKPWEQWLKNRFSMEPEFIGRIQRKIRALNETITADSQLGSQFCVGHSYLTPSEKPSDDERWYRDVVNTEIGPLLEEYWFDDIEAAQKARAELLKEM